MTAETTYTFNGDLLMEKGRAVARDTVLQLQQWFPGVWMGRVPVDTGRLSRTGEAVVVYDGDTYWLIIRAGYPTEAEPLGAFYAIFVELGTAFMAPRAMVRSTADALSAMLPQALQTAGAKQGMA